MSKTADLSGFPIIRIDQIPLVDSDTLVNAQKEIRSLVSSLLTESPGSVPPMVHYLRKQNEAMQSELTNRLAQERINALLSGATALLSEDRNKYAIVDDDDLSTSSMSAITEKSMQSPSIKTKPNSEPLINTSFQPLLLPSELKGRSAPPAAVTSSKAMPIDSASYKQSTPSNASSFKRSETSPIGIAITSRSTDGREGASSEHIISTPDSPVSEHSAQQRPAKRPASGDNRPSRRSQQLINEKFGSMFIVTGGERKKRPLPVKKVVESVDEKNSRERLERRKAAMQRLIARKEERQQHILAQRAKKKAAQREAELLLQQQQQQQATAQESNTSSPGRRTGKGAGASQKFGKPPLPASSKSDKNDVPDDDASDSESVSGGDDDMDVTIDQQMIDTVAQAQRAELLEPASGEDGHLHAEPGGEHIQETNATAVQEEHEFSQSYAADVDEPRKNAAQTTQSHSIGSPAGAKPKRIRNAIVSDSEGSAKSPSNRTQASSRQQQQQQGNIATMSTASPTASSQAPVPAVGGTGKPRNRRASPYRETMQPQSPSRVPNNSSNMSNKTPVSAGTAASAPPQTVLGPHSSKHTSAVSHTISASPGQHSAAAASEDQLALEFEEKNNAALNVLRSMKLKREQMKQASSKMEAPVSNITSSSLVIIESGAGDQDEEGDSARIHPESQNFALVLHSSAAAAADDGLDTSLDEGSVDSAGGAPLLAIANYDHYTQDSAAHSSQGHFVKVSTLKIDDSAVGADGAIQRPNTVPVNSPDRRKLLDNASQSQHSVDSEQSGDDSPLPQMRRRNTALTFPTSNMLQDSADTVPDLSQTTLEVSDNAGNAHNDKPDTSRSVASASHPLAIKLLLHKNSELLYVEDGFYCSRVGPDELPGLRAWKLASIVDECANWVVNIAKYAAIKPSKKMDILDTTPIYQRRAQVRKSVSLGLLMLLLDTEDLLLGSLRLFSAEHFTTLWREYLRLFDEKAETVAMQHGPAVLFREVAVCGNCHAVCKKLENLLKTLFVPTNADEARLHRTLHAQDDVVDSKQHARNTHHHVREQPSQQLSSARPFSGRGDDGVRATETDDTYHDNERNEAQYTPGPRSVQSLEFSENNTDDDDTGGDNGNDGGCSDDEASILPMYNYKQEVVGEEYVGIAATAATAATTVDEAPADSESLTGATFSTVADAGDSGKTRLPRSVDSESPSEALASKIPPVRKNSNTGVKLSSFYPSIGCIFPAAYGVLGGRQAEDGTEAARLLIESMQVQCKIYEEWIEVMSDYSTVFSDDRRGVAEHYFDSAAAAGSEEGAENGAAGNATVYKGGSRSLHFRVKSGRSEVNNIVTDVFNNFLKSWEELPAGLGLGLSWNILWTWSKPRIKMSHLLIWQRVNHYPDSKELTRKDLLKKNIQRYTNMGGKGGAQFDIMPVTFLLPHEYTAFVQAFTAAETSKTTEDSSIQNFWIMKPIGMSRGRGISLIKDLSQIAYSQSSVVQRYIERPLCLKGYKFDLRLYILVTSFKPLEAFIYRDGFARVSTHQYSLNPEDTENKFIHLTNSSIQCQNTEGPSKDSPLQAGEDEEDTGGTKIALQGANGLWKRLAEYGVDIAALWQSICLLVVKSLVMVDDKMVHQPCCFEMFGYDVLIDADLRPWLLEVNASPSLARTNALDVRVKNAMIKDIIGVIDPAPYDRAAVLRILRKRLSNIAKNRFASGRNDPDLEQDLKDILGDYVPRKYGEIPANMGNYEMLCPGTKEFTQVMNLKKKIIKS